MRLKLKGHALYNAGGDDIVCAAASALVGTLSNFLEKKFPGEYEACISSGYAEISTFNWSAKRYFDIIFSGLDDLAGEYPENVKIVR